MKYKTIAGIIIAVLLTAFSYKIFLLYSNNVNYGDIDTNINIKNTLIINSSNELIDPLSFDNVQFENNFSDYQKKDVQGEMLVSYVLTDSNGINQIFSFVKTDDIVKMMRDNNNSFDDKFKKLDKNNILEKYNIKNDIDLIKYMSKRKIEKSTIFSTKNKIIENYLFNYILINEFPSLNDITLITGIYDGYVINSEDLKIVNIIKDNKKYIFTFNGDAFTSEYIKEFLNSLFIK